MLNQSVQNGLQRLVDEIGQLRLTALERTRLNEVVMHLQNEIIKATAEKASAPQRKEGAPGT